MFWLMFVLLPNVWTNLYATNPFAYPKWLIFDVMCVLAAIYLTVKRDIKLPKTQIFLLFIVMAIFRIISTELSKSVVSSSSFLTATGFITLTFAFMQLHRDIRWWKFFWPFAIGGTLLSLQCFTLTSPLGNVNILSEYVILFLPLAIGIREKHDGWKRHWMTALIVSWGFILFLAQSRSAWIGAALIGIYYLRNYKKTLIAAAIIFVTMFATIQYVGKNGSTRHRFDLYLSTIEMIQDHPMGIGGGMFEFGYIPYQLENKEYPREVEIYAAPHNELLKWGAEEGWVFLACAVAFWFLLGRFVFSWHWTSRVFEDFVRGSYLVMLPQILFQFPFENPASLAAMAFLISMILGLQSTEDSLHTSRAKVNIGGVLLTVLLAIMCYGKNYAKYLEAVENKKAEKMELACKLDPSNWRACFLKAMNDSHSEHPENALPWLQLNLRNRPFDFHTLRALAFYYAENGDKIRSCQVTQVYDFLLKDSVLFDDFIKRDCKQIPMPLEFKTPRQFENDYKRWLGLYDGRMP